MIGHVLFGVFLLVLLFLVLSRSDAASSLLSSGGRFATDYTKTLQGR